MSLLRKSMELGFGALLLTKEAAEELLNELGDGSEAEEGERRRLLDELVAKGQRLRQELSDSVAAEVDAAIERSGLVRRRDYEALLARVEVLERRLMGSGVIESASDL